jgi:hypothetical protein
MQHPNQKWMIQIARDIAMNEFGFLAPGQSSRGPLFGTYRFHTKRLKRGKAEVIHDSIK